MKNGIIFLLASIAFLGVHAQSLPGFNLRFNRVIDTVMYTEANSCNYYPNGVVGTTMTVPAGKVWKIVATGPLKYQNMSNDVFYSSCSSGAYCGFAGGTEIDPGGGYIDFVSKVEYYSGSDIRRESTNGQAWLSEGTILRMVFYPVCNAPYYYTRYASSTYVNRMSQFLSILEFNLQP